MNTPAPTTSATPGMSKQAFIKKLAPTAVQIQKQKGVPASISLAQAALESNWGQSELAAKYNNLYGVKGSANTRNIKLPTQEYVNGQWQTVNASFRWYDSWEQSMWAHATLLEHGTSDNSQRYAKVIRSHNYRDAAQGLVDGGYATDPDYASKLIEIIEKYHLNKYDQS
nr:glycoside hydrolase family 73 protein [Weissella uvarum]